MSEDNGEYATWSLNAAENPKARPVTSRDVVDITSFDDITLHSPAQVEVAVPVWTKEKARAFTDGLRNALDGIDAKVAEAIKHQVWAPLGYGDFATWWESEELGRFRLSKTVLRQAVVQLFVADNRLSNRALGKAVGVNHETVRDWLVEEGLREPKKQDPQMADSATSRSCVTPDQEITDGDQAIAEDEQLHVSDERPEVNLPDDTLDLDTVIQPVGEETSPEGGNPSAPVFSSQVKPQPQEAQKLVVLSIQIEDKLTVENMQAAYDKLRTACMNHGFLFDPKTYKVSKWVPGS